MKTTPFSVATLCAVVAAQAFAELPDAATFLARIQARRVVSKAFDQTNGPSLKMLYEDYLTLPLDAPPAREAEGWFAILDRLRETRDYDSFQRLNSDYGSCTLAPFFHRLPSAEAWPTVREGLDRRAAAATNAVPLLDALQFVFARLAHDESAASNSLARLRDASAGRGEWCSRAFRELEWGLNRQARLPTEVLEYFAALENGRRYLSIPRAFLRLPPDRLWQLTAPVLTNDNFVLNRHLAESEETPRELLSLAKARQADIAVKQGFTLVDHTEAGCELYESLLARFGFLAVAFDLAAQADEDGKAEEKDKDLAEEVKEVPDELSPDMLADMLARAQRRKHEPDGYLEFRKATRRVLRGVLVREGLPGAFAFAARFPTNFFRHADIFFDDGGVAEVDFLERFVLDPQTSDKDGDIFGSDAWNAYVNAAMRCGQSARARAFLDRIRAQGPWRVDLRKSLRLAAFDDDEAAIAALSREFRERLSKSESLLEYEDGYAVAAICSKLTDILSATTNRAELASLADALLRNTAVAREWFVYLSDEERFAPFDAVGLADKALDLAVAVVEPDYWHNALDLHGAILPLYRNAGRYEDIVALVEGDPDIPATNALRLVEIASGSLVETYAEALAKTGRGADAAAIAKLVVLRSGESAPRDWPFRILAGEMEPESFMGLMDALYAADRFEERPLIWKAEALRRAGRLEEAESVARKAVETDPTDGETRAGDRIRSYAVLADILEARGKVEESRFFRSAVKAVRLAEEGDKLKECGLTRRSLAKYVEAEKYFSAAYCVQWREAERLRELGLGEAAAHHYEETFRQLPAQFGFVASLCFGCSGLFDSPGAVLIAERILTEAASAATPAPAACHLLGKLREKQGRYQEAFEAYARAADLAPEYLDALVAQNGLRFKVRRPREEWERIQSRIFALDPLGRHSPFGDAEILDWGLAKRLESEALRKFPAPDFASVAGIVIPASAAKSAGHVRKDDVRHHSSELSFYHDVAPNRELDKSDLVKALSRLVGAFEGFHDHGDVAYCMGASAPAYDDLMF